MCFLRKKNSPLTHHKGLKLFLKENLTSCYEYYEYLLHVFENVDRNVNVHFYDEGLLFKASDGVSTISIILQQPPEEKLNASLSSVSNSKNLLSLSKKR